MAILAILLGSFLALLLFEFDEPEINFVYLLNFLGKHLLVGIAVDFLFAEALSKVADDGVKVVHFRVHNAQVADQPDFLHLEPALVRRSRVFWIHHLGLPPKIVNRLHSTYHKS